MAPRRSQRLIEKAERAALPRRSERLRQLSEDSQPIRRTRRSRASAGSRIQQQQMAAAAVVPPIGRTRRSRASAGSRIQMAAATAVVPPSPPSTPIRRSIQQQQMAAAVLPPSPPSTPIRRSLLEILNLPSLDADVPFENLQAASTEASALRPPSPAAVAGTSAVSALRPPSPAVVAGTSAASALRPPSPAAVAGTSAASALRPPSPAAVAGTSAASALRPPSPAVVAGTSTATDPDAVVSRCHAGRRLRRELQKFMSEPPEGCAVELVDDNILNWRATITGPPETPYEGGAFDLALVFTNSYPFEAPGVVFLTRVYHCNVGTTGNICMNILYRDWSPALTVPKLLLSIISLLSDPNPHDPLVASIAEVLLRDPDEYAENARMWTRRYAKPRNNQEVAHQADAE